MKDNYKITYFYMRLISSIEVNKSKSLSARLILTIIIIIHLNLKRYENLLPPGQWVG